MDVGRFDADSVKPTPRRPAHATKETDLRASETTRSDGMRPPQVTQRGHTINPSSPRREEPRTKGSFSCRRWRKLTGASSPSPPVVERTPAVPLPSHSSASVNAPEDFVAVFPTSSSTRKNPVGSKPRPTRGGVQWQDVERFDCGVMQQLVDKAYGVTPPGPHDDVSLRHGTRTAQRRRQFIHNHVYLPSVHRTLDYLERARASPRDYYGAAPPPRLPRPAPLGTKLLSTQLRSLQEELLLHYTHNKTASSTLPSQLWHPHPPQRSASPPLTSSGSTESLPLARRAGSFRSLHHAKPTRQDVTDETPREEEEEEEEDRETVLMLTDSDTNSLSSGADADSELDPSTVSTPPRVVPASLCSGSTDSASWASLTSHVLLALEGAEGSPTGSVEAPRVAVYDRNDVALFTDTNSELSDGTSSAKEAKATNFHRVRASDAEDDYGQDSDHEQECDHVVFVDNGVRVNAAGEAVAGESDAWRGMRTDSKEGLQSESSSVPSSETPSEDRSQQRLESASSSGAEADSERENSSSLSSGTSSWASLESHVLLVLEGTEATRIDSESETLAAVYDSDDVRALITDTSNEPSDSGASSVASQAVLTDTTAEEAGFARDDGDRQECESESSEREDNESGGREDDGHTVGNEPEHLRQEHHDHQDETTLNSVEDAVFSNEHATETKSEDGSLVGVEQEDESHHGASEDEPTTEEGSPFASEQDLPVSETSPSDAPASVETGEVLHRYSISSATTYDDADFEDSDNDVASIDGDESFEV